MQEGWNPLTQCLNGQCNGIVGIGQSFNLTLQTNLFDPAKFVGGYQAFTIDPDNAKFYKYKGLQDGTNFPIRTKYFFGGTNDWSAPISSIDCSSAPSWVTQETQNI
jgi:hypothetical protein